MEKDATPLKYYFWILLDLALAAFFINLVFFVMPTIARFGNSLFSARTITISAEGKTIVSPDIAELSFSVVTRGQNPGTIADENNEKVSEAIEFVKSKAVESEDIKTAGYNLSPEYRYDPDTGESSITGYTLTQSVHVKVRDLGNVAPIIGGLPPLGINQIGGIVFTVDDPEEFLAEARADGFKRAKAKASRMAKEAGIRLGRITSVFESGGSPPPYPIYARNFGLGGAPEVADAIVPQIEPGTEELRVQVSVTYEIK